MPNIEYSKTGGNIVWSAPDFLAGLHPQYGVASSSIRFLTDKMAAQVAVNPFRYLGALLPGAQPTDVTTNGITLAETSLNTVVKTTGVSPNQTTDAYIVTSGARIFKTNSINAPQLQNSGAYPHTITGTTVSGNDITLYNIGATQYGFYSYNDTGGSAKGNIGRLAFTSTFIDDYLTNASYLNYSAGLKSAVPHALVVGDDDTLYVADGNLLHGIDGQAGANGTFYPAVLTLPFNYIITSFARIQNFLVIFAYLDNSFDGTYPLGNAKAFFWNYIDLDPTQVVDLTDNYVNGGFQYKSTIGCFTQGRNENNLGSKPSKIKIWDGSIFDTKVTFDENIPTPGGVEVLGNTINWNAGGVLYQWGTPFPEDIKNSFNKIAQGSGTTSGILRTLNQSVQLMSSGSNLQEVDVVFTGFYDGALAVLPTAEPVYPKGYRGRVKKVRIQFAYNVTSGRNLVFRLVRSGTASAGQITTLIPNSDNFQSADIDTLVKEFETDSSGSPLPAFVSIRPDLTWNTGAGKGDALPIERIEIEYDLVNYQNV